MKFSTSVAAATFVSVALAQVSNSSIASPPEPATGQPSFVGPSSSTDGPPEPATGQPSFVGPSTTHPASSSSVVGPLEPGVLTFTNQGANATSHPASSAAHGNATTSGHASTSGHANGTATGSKPHGGDVTTTVITSNFVTYCPSATTFTINSKTYTVSSATTITITNCPCTIPVTKPTSASPSSAKPTTVAPSAVQSHTSTAVVPKNGAGSAAAGVAAIAAGVAAALM